MKVSPLTLLYLALLSMLGFIATDMYLPAFKAMEQSFATGPEAIALSLSIFLAGLAMGQIVWGILSDRFGHARMLFAGLVIFTIASLGLAFSQSVWQLLALRFVQAIGVCAPTVIWQAMVIDRYESKVSQQIFATIMPLVALSPALAPQLGVQLANHFGWPSIFMALTVIGVLLALATLKQPHSARQSNPEPLARAMKNLVSNRAYLGNVMIFASASAAFFAYLTGMPEIMAKMGYSPDDIASSFIPQTIAFIVGGYGGKWAVQRFGEGIVLRLMLSLFSLSALTILAASQSGISQIWPLLSPFCLIAVANGAVYPIVVNRALSQAKESPAMAAGLQNSLQICLCSLASAIVARFASQALSVTGIVIAVCFVTLWCGYFLAKRPAQNAAPLNQVASDKL
ncbi:Inner membrane transport protein YdhC [Vibrio stylophorae]|uniref:Bcr/CflA family efflux transporter n=1 Tax=Vibrio stylophorae TaxID=659351 RepID=A0ABM8ZWD2_9VIBR|nr:purine nucleoside transporter PunC [Vibrio stylophorae]CAH0534323.1 Inner membrane transport protein YdhC [Vibrio stylophorae]